MSTPSPPALLPEGEGISGKRWRVAKALGVDEVAWGALSDGPRGVKQDGAQAPAQPPRPAHSGAARGPTAPSFGKERATADQDEGWCSVSLFWGAMSDHLPPGPVKGRCR